MKFLWLNKWNEICTDADMNSTAREISQTHPPTHTGLVQTHKRDPNCSFVIPTKLSFVLRSPLSKAHKFGMVSVSRVTRVYVLIMPSPADFKHPPPLGGPLVIGSVE